MNFYLFLFLCCVVISLSYCSDKPRGIPFSKLSFYQPNVPFKCLDGSGTISWNKVNDDYCDCRDASDEPGTAACSNGFFYCDNKGHRGVNIFSSRVNDGICDCCDGGDEYNGLVQCNNTCWELGEKAREQDKRVREAAERGHVIYLEYVKDFETSVGQKRTKLDTIKEELNSLTEERLTVERRKSDAEAVEKEAKRIAEEQWKVLQAENETMQEKKKISEAFSQLDVDGNGRVGYEELQSHHEFDIDQNGEVSIEEAKEYLNEHESIDETEFVDSIWTNIKQIFKFKESAESTANDFDGAVPDASDQSPDDDNLNVPTTNVDAPKLEYDDATRELIEAADQARINYSDINDKYTKLEEEKKSIEDLLNIDYGPSSAFYRLAETGVCYELTDREYTYKLCPFKNTAQMAKDGGPETELGRWGRWSGGSDNVYSAQTYEGGAGCWNGPSRSTRVEIECGIENRLLSASEPSRCEYKFEFQTPAACNKSPEELSHDEL